MRRLHFALSVTALATSLATSLLAAHSAVANDWTVLTMAPDGSWGAATSFPVNRAIAADIANCKIEYQRELGCGAVFTTTQGGWTLGIRCGRQNIVVTAETLAETQEVALRSEADLRENYIPNMPSCRQLVIVDPKGSIIVPNSDERDRIVNR